MRRAVLLFVLSLALGQALGLDWVPGDDACAQDCPDDADGRKCPPLCPDCACGLRFAAVLPAVAPVVVRLPTRTRLVFSESDRAPSTPEPREILHVPIFVLA